VVIKMIDYRYKEHTREIKVPLELEKNIEKIFSTSVIINNINEELAKFLVDDNGILSALNKEIMTWTDWKYLKESCKSSSRMTFENNGILMEFLCQYILPNIFDINSLLLYQEPSFEDPEGGNDLLFFDSKGNVFIFEVKSKISNNYSHTELKKVIKKGYTSLFCSSEIKNHKKICIARKITEDLYLSKSKKDIIFDSLETIEEVEGNIISLCNNDKIFLNICIIGNGFNYTDEELREDLKDALFSNNYCKRNCKYNDTTNHNCTINRLQKSFILNIISIEFPEELSVTELNNKIIQRIEIGKLDVQ